MVIDIDEGYPNTYIFDMDDNMLAEFSEVGYEVEANELLFEKLWKMIDNAECKELPCEIYKTIRSFSY